MRKDDPQQLFPATCPSIQLWSNFFIGAVDESTLQAMSEHLEACASCAKVVEQLSSSSKKVLHGGKSPYLTEPNYFRMLARLEAAQVASDVGDTIIDHATSREQTVDTPISGMVGRFLVRGVLGAGGFGRVYLATDPLLNRSVAIKAPRHSEFDSEGDLSNFLDEARHAAALDHPGIVPIFDVLADDSGRTLIVMKYVAGKSLSARLLEGPLELANSLGIMIQVAKAMHFAHQRGFVHRDLKPANILLDEQGRPHVSDLGLGLNLAKPDAKVLRGGTPAYMSPEQVAHGASAVDRRSDVWSLGVMLAELVHGRRPFPQKKRSELFDAILRDSPQFESSPETKSVDAIIRRCLAKSPADRYPTTELLADDLATVLRRISPEGLEKYLYGWRRNLLVATVFASLMGVMVFGRLQLKQRELRFSLSQLESSPVNQFAKLVERIKASGVSASAIKDYGRSADWSGQLRLDVAAIAVGDGDEETIKRCVDGLQSTEPEDIAVIVGVLRESNSLKQLAQQIAGRLSESAEFDQSHFKLSAALAGFEPKHAIWNDIRLSVAQKLVGLAQNEMQLWLPLFESVGNLHLATPLTKLMNDQNLETQVQVCAASTLARYLAGDPQQLATIIGDADASELEALLPGLKATREDSVRCLTELFNGQFNTVQTVPHNDQAPPTDRDVKSARFAVALCLLDSFDACFETLQPQPDPTLLTLVIHGLAEQDIDADTVVTLLNSVQRDDLRSRAIQFGLLQVLAELPIDSVRSRAANLALGELLEKLHLCADCGIHSMARLVASRYGIELTPLEHKNYGQWLVDSIGDSVQDFFIAEPCTVELGIHDGQIPTPGAESWLRHKRRFPRRIAVATNEVTINQFRTFDPSYIDNFNLREPRDAIFLESAPDAAMMLVTLDAARRFCNAWSTAAALECCYEPKVNDRGETKLEPKENCCLLNGYRLPTDGEWEMVCRAGTETSRYFGNASQYVAQYGWTLERSGQYALASNGTAILSQRVAQLIPNRWGLFDMYGNATELCELGASPTDSASEVLDELAQDLAPGPGWPLIRGASLAMPGVNYGYSHCRSKSIGGAYSREFGIRVVRTLTVDDASESNGAR